MFDSYKKLPCARNVECCGSAAQVIIIVIANAGLTAFAQLGIAIQSFSSYPTSNQSPENIVQAVNLYLTKFWQI